MIKCQKCAKAAIVHLTEVITAAGNVKQPVEIHLCLAHAVEAGIMVPTAGIPPQVLAAQGPKGESIKPTAIVPAPEQPAGLVVARPNSDAAACPICGNSWNQFKQTGVMGCPHDYELFAAKMLPLLKRAQEGACDHVGKMPPGRKTRDTERQVTSLRLRRELQKAIHAEMYEQAAQLRDALRQLEQN